MAEERSLPILLNNIHAALQKAEDIGEVKDLRDKAEALRKYSAQAGHGLEMQNRAAEAKQWAERRAGELMPKEFPHGGNTRSRLDEETLKGAGITKFQSHRLQTIAKLP